MCPSCVHTELSCSDKIQVDRREALGKTELLSALGLTENHLVRKVFLGPRHTCLVVFLTFPELVWGLSLDFFLLQLHVWSVSVLRRQHLQEPFAWLASFLSD